MAILWSYNPSKSLRNRFKPNRSCYFSQKRKWLPPL